MKYLTALAIVLAVGSQSARTQTQTDAPGSLLTAAQASMISSRAVQLMESAATAVPGLLNASDSLRRSADETVGLMKKTPQNAVLTNRFVLQLRAFTALSDAFTRPSPFPQTAADQFTEFRDLQDKMQRNLSALLEASARTATSRDADPNNLKRYAEANTKLPPGGKTPRVVFFGDSITDSWRLNEYFTDRDFVNRGISGQTTTQMLGRFLQDVASVHPKAVLVLAGTNDIARGIPLTGIEDNLTMIAELAKLHGITAIFASILPVSDYHKNEDPRWEMTRIRPPAMIVQLNAWLRDYCRRENLLYVDYYSAMVDASGQLNADEADDGLHPNAKGYRVMSPLALQAIDRVLAQPTSAGTPGTQKRRLGIVAGPAAK